MESDSRRVQEQADAIREGEVAASRSARTPLWFWLTFAVVNAVLVYAVASGNVLLCGVLAIANLAAWRVLTVLLDQQRGIRIGRVFGVPGSWIAIPWFAALVLLAAGGNLLSHGGRLVWVGAAAALLSVTATVAFGLAYDRLRLSRRTRA